jgi:hypothetical protein
MQWRFAGDPSPPPVAWNAAPANLDIAVESNALFRASSGPGPQAHLHLTER